MNPSYGFDDVRVDPAAFRVTKAGIFLSLEPKAFSVLLVLLENPGRLVEKKELLERVWPDAVVTESAMTRVIADLRRALGDAAHEARYIETVPTKGYRFIAEVRRVDERIEPAPADFPVAPASSARLKPAWVTAGAVALGLIVLAAVFLALRAPRSRPAAAPAAAPLKLRQITDSTGLDAYPTFSPDGAHLAYCSDRDGPFEIYIRQLAPGGREIRLTSDGRENLQPAWSPDGSRIAYASRNPAGIWLVAALGGEPRRLTSFGAHPAWSPDGKTIAFQSDAPAGLTIEGPPAAEGSSLWTVPAAGGEPAPLTRAANPPGGHGAPVFSPDGNDVVFLTLTGIWSVSRKDGAVHRNLPRKEDQTPGSPASFYYDADFSPDGTLYFTTRGVNATLWRARPSSGAGARWAAPESVTSGGTSTMRHIAVSREGKVAYAAVTMTSNLSSIPLDPKSCLPSGEPVPLTRTAGRRALLPRFSPDGRRIAFVSGRAGSPWDIWVVDADGGDARQVTLGFGASYPDWFAAGDRIAFGSRKGGSWGIWSVDLGERTEKRHLSLGEDASAPRLSPDGRSVAYHKQTPDQGLHTVIAPLDGGRERRVTPEGVDASFPSWSRDGKTLAIEILHGADWHLGTVPAVGGTPTVLVSEKGMSWPFDFSPDDERIAFAGQRDGIWNLYWVSRRDRSVRRLTDYRERRTYVRYPAWSPRGDRIVYELCETTGNIWLLEPPK